MPWQGRRSAKPVRDVTTTRLHVYHHRDVGSGGLPVELATEAVFVLHDHAVLRLKVIADTPTSTASPPTTARPPVCF